MLNSQVKHKVPQFSLLLSIATYIPFTEPIDEHANVLERDTGSIEAGSHEEHGPEPTVGFPNATGLNVAPSTSR